MEDEVLQVLFARQAIYDKTNAVYAYELLYRRHDDYQSLIDNTVEMSGIIATSSVIAELFTNLDIDSIIGNKLAFINFTYQDIIQGIPKLLPKDRIVIEVLETVSIDQILISHLLELHKEGYTIALDDFVYKTESEPLMKIADIIKLDVLNQSKPAIIKQLKSIQGFKGKLLAEKIENKDQFSCCVELGFDYFQGFYLNKPKNVVGQVLTENTTQLLKILTELNNANPSIKNLEKSILNVPKLSYRILRVANSAYYYSGKEINSLADAIFRIGLMKVIQWANLILLASNKETSFDLIERTLIRAYMCECISKTNKQANPDEAYTVGMFSTLDGMLNEPLPSLLSKINLRESFNQALLQHDGNLGAILKCVIDYEQGHLDALKNLPISQKEQLKLYLDGIAYAKAKLTILKSTR